MSFAFDGVGLPPELWASILACSDISVIARLSMVAKQWNDVWHLLHKFPTADKHAWKVIQHLGKRATPLKAFKSAVRVMDLEPLKNHITQDAIEQITKLFPNITELLIRKAVFTEPKVFSIIATNLPFLTKLAVTHQPCVSEVESLTAISSIANLRDLNLAFNTKLTGSSMKYLRKLSKLESVDLRTTSIRPSDFTGSFPILRELCLNPGTDEDLSSIAQLPSLTYLALRMFEGTQLDSISDLAPRLKELDLRWSLAVTDGMLRSALKGFSELETLRISYTSATKEGVATLGLPKLTTIEAVAYRQQDENGNGNIAADGFLQDSPRAPPGSPGPIVTTHRGLFRRADRHLDEVLAIANEKIDQSIRAMRSPVLAIPIDLSNHEEESLLSDSVYSTPTRHTQASAPGRKGFLSHELYKQMGPTVSTSGMEFDEVNKRWIGNNQTAVKFQQGVAAGDDDDFFPDEEDSFDEDDYISSTSPERKHSFRQQHRSSRMRTIYMQGSSNDEKIEGNMRLDPKTKSWVSINGAEEDVDWDSVDTDDELPMTNSFSGNQRNSSGIPAEAQDRGEPPSERYKSKYSLSEEDKELMIRTTAKRNTEDIACKWYPESDGKAMTSIEHWKDLALRRQIRDAQLLSALQKEYQHFTVQPATRAPSKTPSPPTGPSLISPRYGGLVRRLEPSRPVDDDEEDWDDVDVPEGGITASKLPTANGGDHSRSSSRSSSSKELPSVDGDADDEDDFGAGIELAPSALSKERLDEVRRKKQEEATSSSSSGSEKDEPNGIEDDVLAVDEDWSEDFGTEDSGKLQKRTAAFGVVSPNSMRRKAARSH